MVACIMARKDHDNDDRTRNHAKTTAEVTFAVIESVNV